MNICHDTDAINTLVYCVCQCIVCSSVQPTWRICHWHYISSHPSYIHTLSEVSKPKLSEYIYFLGLLIMSGMKDPVIEAYIKNLAPKGVWGPNSPRTFLGAESPQCRGICRGMRKWPNWGNALIHSDVFNIVRSTTDIWHSQDPSTHFQVYFWPLLFLRFFLSELGG